MTTATAIERLHIGGRVRREGWHVLDIEPRPEVDFVGSITDLSQFESDSVGEIYASHVFEHLDYKDELRKAFSECRRVIRTGGCLRLSVPDLVAIGSLLAKPDLSFEHEVYLMRVLYGGHVDEFDYHKVGFTANILASFLHDAGFENVINVKEHNLFQDCSLISVDGVLISLNVVAVK